MTDAEIALLPSFPKLSELRVSIPSDAALETIAKLPHLSRLEIDVSKITDNGLKVLESARVLSDVSLPDDISQAAAQAFANARPDVIVKWKQTRLDPVDPERAVAEWIINSGGTVGLKKGGSVSKLADLPKEPLTIIGATLRNIPGFTVTDVDRLATLRELNELQLYETKLSVEVARRLSEALSVESLTVSGSQSGDSSALRELLKMPTLRTFETGGTNIDDQFFAEIGQLKRLKTLMLTDCKKVTDDGLARLAANPPPKLQHLRLTVMKVGVRGLRALAQIPHLATLSMRGSSVDDAGLAELERCPNLCRLDVTDTQVTRAGTTSLQKALNGCQIIVSKSEQATPLDDQAYRDTMRLLMERGYAVSISTNDLKSQKTAARGNDSFPAGDVLYAGYVSGTYAPPVQTVSKDLKLIAKLRDLPALQLNDLPADGLRELLPLTNLFELKIGAPALSDEDAALLPSFKKLCLLGASVSSDTALESIARLPQLSTLQLSIPAGASLTSLKPLESVATLSELSIHPRLVEGFTEADAQAFASARPDVIVYWNGKRLRPVAPEIKPAIPQTPPTAIAPFDAKQARAHQEAWAKHLGLKVETTNSVGQTMILIPPGEFLMGSTDEQVAAALKAAGEFKADQATTDRIQRTERPQHKVVITKPLLMSATEVTIGQFKKFVENSKYVTDAEQYGFGDSAEKVISNRITDAQKQMNWRTPGYAVDDNSPVAQMTWNDAVAYCKWLSEQEKTTYRLPTEAEWEYACRAGTTTQYSFGDDYNELPNYGWHNKNSGGKSHPVGKLLPNGFGLFDMHGNLYEWCGDFFDEKWYFTLPLNDPIGPPASSYRVIRGGDWNPNASYCRSACRNNTLPLARNSSHGFRCVSELTKAN